jgi:hypothetical protein
VHACGEQLPSTDTLALGLRRLPGTEAGCEVALRRGPSLEQEHGCVEAAPLALSSSRNTCACASHRR